MALTNDERLAAQRAIAKLVNAAVKDSESAAKAEFLEMHETHGVKQRVIRIGDEEVGIIYATKHKPKVIISPLSKPEAIAFLSEHGLTLTEEKPAEGWEAHFIRADDHVEYVDENGECHPAPPCFVWSYGYDGAAIKGCEPEDVLPLVMPELQGSIQLLLGGDTSNNTPDYGEEPEVSHV